MPDLLHTVLKTASSILPVLSFLILLRLADSYKLVALRAIVLSVLAGSGAAVAAYGIHAWFFHAAGLPAWLIDRWLSPCAEETLKGVYVYYLARTARIGFLMDSAIHGFAVGTGFAVFENSFYLFQHISEPVYFWLLRGFGTAVMHGGTSACLAILVKYDVDRRGNLEARTAWRGWALAVILHVVFNHFILPPPWTTTLVLILWPATVILVFNRSERDLREWLGVGIDTDIELLNLIRRGEVSNTRIGRYVHRFRKHFKTETLADLLCYIRLYVELRLLAKGMLMAREIGFSMHVKPDARSKFAELCYLEKQIGETGLIVLRPFLHKDLKDPWVIQRLGNRSVI